MSSETWIQEFFKDNKLMSVLSSIMEAPKSAKEISSDCNLPISTVYKKLHLLYQKGFLNTSEDVSNDGVKTRKFAKK
jgi:predicted transcriptional regulator